MLLYIIVISAIVFLRVAAVNAELAVRFLKGLGILIGVIVLVIALAYEALNIAFYEPPNVKVAREKAEAAQACADWRQRQPGRINSLWSDVPDPPPPNCPIEEHSPDVAPISPQSSPPSIAPQAAPYVDKEAKPKQPAHPSKAAPKKLTPEMLREYGLRKLEGPVL
jgi:hypothetical protein